MELALYHPTLGFYQKEGKKIGKWGHFSTSSSISPLFARLLAGKLVDLAEKYNLKPLQVVEFGGGTGVLAREVVDYLKTNASFSYLMVETSPWLRKEQQQLLAGYDRVVKWRDISSLTSRSVLGLMLQNEVIDAFPVHRLVLTGDGFKEVYVDYQRGEFSEVLVQVSDDSLKSYLDKYVTKLRVGQQIEVNLKALSWLENLAAILRRGAIITIDYGDLARDLYSASRLTGTLVGYYRHQLQTNPYKHIGDQDLTAHLNFTALIKRGEELGLKTCYFGTQADFLLSHGLLEKLEEISQSDMPEAEKRQLLLSAKTLILPQGMGERFKVLIQLKT
jgi:SAM-dependent MidA family methyltransferase